MGVQYGRKWINQLWTSSMTVPDTTGVPVTWPPVVCRTAWNDCNSSSCYWLSMSLWKWYNLWYLKVKDNSLPIMNRSVLCHHIKPVENWHSELLHIGESRSQFKHYRHTFLVLLQHSLGLPGNVKHNQMGFKHIFARPQETCTVKQPILVPIKLNFSTAGLYPVWHNWNIQIESFPTVYDMPI